MEFKEVVGRRRTIRYYQPWRPVEREKIQTILEAARLASCAVNASFLRAIVVETAKLARETLDALKLPVSAVNLELAPLHIYFYGDLKAVEEGFGRRGGSLKELFDLGILTPGLGWSHKFVDEFVWPMILQPMVSNLQQHMQAVVADCGVAICQALLCAFDEGLGAGLNAFNAAIAKQAFGVPDHWVPIYCMSLGYPAESWEAGGQRPRPPLEEQFFEGKYGTPFHSDPAVVEKLKEAKMIQAPAPLPWRKEEVRALSRMLGLPE